MRILPTLGAMLLVAFPVLAQEHDHPAGGQAAQQGGGMAMQGGMTQHGNMQGGMMDMNNMMGQHMMPVTVTAIDGKTGLVDVTAGSMALKLHFPPPSLAGVKPGDKIMVHLAFHKS